MRKLLEAVALLALVAMFAMLAMYSDLLPDQIPIHWDAGGTPDRWGSKATLWIFPSFGAVIYAGLSIAGFVRRAKLDEARQQLITQMLSAVKVVTMVSFAVMSRGKLEAAMGHASNFGSILAIVMIVLMGAGWIYARRGPQHES